MAVTLPTSDVQGMQVAEFDTRKLLAHAARQARERNYQDLLIVDVDSHHYETESMREILEYIEDPVLRHLARASSMRGQRAPNSLGGPTSATRTWAAASPRYSAARIGEDAARRGSGDADARDPLDGRDGHRHRDALPDADARARARIPLIEMQTALAAPTIAGSSRRCCPASRACARCSTSRSTTPTRRTDGAWSSESKPGVSGFLVPATHNIPVHDNAFMKIYARARRTRPSDRVPRQLQLARPAFAIACNRFISVHALGFVFYNMMHMTNWIVNGLPERFPKLKVIWMESGLAWVPFMMQRLDNEYMMRSNECPSLKRSPSDYMRKMYYSTQPMEMPDNGRARRRPSR